MTSLLQKKHKSLLKTTIKLCFLLFCIVCSLLFFLMLVHFFNNGLNAKSLKTIGLFWTKFFNNPLYLYDSYVFWWSSFVENCHSGNFNWTMFVPLMTPLLLFAYLLWCYIRSTYSFGLWYFFNNRFAKLKDVERMGLLNGTFAILGKINGKILSLNKPSNVLCFGNEGSGKDAGIRVRRRFIAF